MDYPKHITENWLAGGQDTTAPSEGGSYLVPYVYYKPRRGVVARTLRKAGITLGWEKLWRLGCHKTKPYSSIIKAYGPKV